MARKGFADVLERKSQSVQDPTKKMPVQEQIGRTQKKLSEDDRRGLRMQIDAKEEEIRAKMDMNPDADVSEMKRELEHKKMIVQHDDDLGPKSESQRDRLAARASEIEQFLIKNMPTKKEMWAKTGTSESAQAVRHQLKYQGQFAELEHEWQDIKNKLEPEDPGAASLELIRPD